MSEPFTEDESAKAKLVLAQYVEDHCNDSESVLLRPNCYCMTEEEIEGEVLDLVLSYLTKRNFDSPLKSALAHHVALKIAKNGLEKFLQEDDAHAAPNDADVKSYNAMEIGKAVFENLLELCKEWLHDMPSLFKNKYSYVISMDAIKNKRRKMEDKHVVLTEFNVLHGLNQETPSQAFFSVFDGHGGIDAACFASSQLHCNLKKFEKLLKQPVEALRYAFTKTDADFICKAKRERLKSGSTGVTVLIQDNILHIGWVGDSQVILGKKGVAINLMDPHKPDREDERRRIEELGGCVVWFGGWRVNGSLAVSRAIGDFEQKPFVSADADVSQYILEGDEDYLILGCDGLWDTVDASSAVELVDNFILEGKEKTECAKMLVQKAKSRGSMDNISVVVVFLDAHKQQSRVHADDSQAEKDT